MYDSQVVIKKRMLQRLNSGVTRLEGGFASDVLAASAIEFENAELAVEYGMSMALPDTAEDEYLDRLCSPYGIYRKPAVKSSGIVKITGSEGTTIVAGNLLGSSAAMFVALETKTVDATGIMTVLVECQTPGSAGNVAVGAINYFPVRISGLTSVTNEAAFDNGYDGETNDQLRERYYARVRTPPTSGNKYDYYNWAMEITGVGGAKVFPLWDGPSTVKVIIIDSNGTGSEVELIDAVIANIEESRPIGAIVTVESATELPINLICSVTLEIGYALDVVTTTIQTAVSAYLKPLAFVTGAYISYAKVGNAILDSEGVIDYAGLTVNGGTANVAIAETTVAVLGTTIIT